MWMLHEGRTLWWKLIAQCCSRPASWRVTISWGVSSRAKTSGGRGVQRQQKDVLAVRIVSFEPINFHLDKEAPYSVAAWQSWERWRSCKNFLKLIRSDLNSTLIFNSKTKEENWVLGTDIVSSFPCHIHSHSALYNVYPVALDRTKR